MIDRRTASPLIWRFLCAAVTLVILWLALMPAASAPAGFGWDKLNHAGAMAAATWLAYLTLQPRPWAATAAFFYGASLGIVIEILQGALTTSRAAEWGDVVADLIGAGCAWCVIRIYQRITGPKL